MTTPIHHRAEKPHPNWHRTPAQRRAFPAFAFLVAIGVPVAILAQQAPATTRPATEEVVELSPFTVNTSRDLGYQAENTLQQLRGARPRWLAGPHGRRSPDERSEMVWLRQ